MKKKIIALLVSALTLSCIVTGCTFEEEYVPENTEIQSADINEETGEINANQLLDVPGESFKLSCDYDTGNYDVKNWRVTASKAINMIVHTESLPEGYDVNIDHVHTDISLVSVSPQINGIIQDSMDDTSHSLSQDGFYINNDTNYVNTFSIEGYTDQFYQLWGYAFGTYGTISSSYERLTEANIIKVGTYGEKLQVVYDISVKGPDDTKYHTVSVLSELIIPVSQDLSNITKTVGF